MRCEYVRIVEFGHGRDVPSAASRHARSSPTLAAQRGSELRSRDVRERVCHFAGPPAAEVKAERELRMVVQAMVRPAERDDAVGVVATTSPSWHNVSRIDGRALADHASEARDLGPLRRRRRYERRPDHPASSHAIRRRCRARLRPGRRARRRRAVRSTLQTLDASELCPNFVPQQCDRTRSNQTYPYNQATS